jgi:hypothetical protein
MLPAFSAAAICRYAIPVLRNGRIRGYTEFECELRELIEKSQAGPAAFFY